MAATEGVNLRAILEECRDGRNGGAFNEVVVMLESTAASAEVNMGFDGLRFTPDFSVSLLEKYPDPIALPAEACCPSGGRP